MIIQHRSKRKPTGGLYNKHRKKKKRDFGSDFLPVRIGPVKQKIIRTLGGNAKVRLMQADRANITDPSTGKTQANVKIVAVKENKANVHFVRMNVVTKGAIIDTDAGLARVTSRPSQHGIVNAVLVKK